MKPMTPTQARALEAVVEWQDETLPGTLNHTRALIAGTMIITIIGLTRDQLAAIDEIINQ